MANFTTRRITDDEYKQIMDAAQDGFYYTENGTRRHFRPNYNLAGVLMVMMTQGIRVSDAVRIKLANIRDTGNGYELEIYEQKTGKRRITPVKIETRLALVEYAQKQKIADDEYLFKTKSGKPIGTAAIHKQLLIITNYLNIIGVSTHSFRKAALTEIALNTDIYTAQFYGNHSNPVLTARYIRAGRKNIDTAADILARYTVSLV